MSTYRVTIKYWDRHYGDGHVQFKRNFEARTSTKADQEAISILENALKSHSKPQGRIAEAWAERSDRGYPSTLRAYNGSSGSWVQVDPVRPAVMREARRYPKQELPPPRFVTPRVADFDTLDDLIGHAGRELGATHSSGSEANTKLYFPRGGRYPYEEATVWRKAGYWHAQGPGARMGVQRLPESARPISAPSRRAAEAPRRQRRGSDPQEPIVKRWMNDSLLYDVHGEFIDSHTGEVNTTKLAEECAIALGHTEWLDDETSPVWDWAFEVAQAFEQGGGAVRESPTDRAPVHIPEAAIEAARKKFLIELRAISPGQPESWYQRQMERQPMFQNPSMYPWQFDLGSTSRSKRSHAVRDYVVIDRHDRTVAGPFKSSSDAHQAAGSAGVVKFIPSKPARAAETRSAHRRPPRRTR